MINKIKKWIENERLIRRLKFKQLNGYGLQKSRPIIEAKILKRQMITIEDWFKECEKSYPMIKLPSIYVGARDNWNILKKYKIKKDEIWFSFNKTEELSIKGDFYYEVIFEERYNTVSLIVTKFSLIEYVKYDSESFTDRKERIKWTFKQGVAEFYI